MGGAQRLGALLLALGTPLCAQPPRTPRIDVLGASVSAGYVDLRMPESGIPNDTVPLFRVLRHVWPAETATVTNRADIAMFANPERFGGRQIIQSRRNQPDLVLAVDFMFWFGYGNVRPGDEGRKQRLELQRKALELLDRIECPIILGDYPDMNGASARMLHPRMIPDEETLIELNARLRAWAAERPRVHLFPLAQWVKHLKEDGVTLPLEEGPVQSPPLYLLQADRLHATRLGVTLLAYQLQKIAKETLPQGHQLNGEPVTLDHLIEAVGAGPDLEGIRKAPRPVFRQAFCPGGCPLGKRLLRSSVLVVSGRTTVRRVADEHARSHHVARAFQPGPATGGRTRGQDHLARPHLLGRGTPGRSPSACPPRHPSLVALG